MRRSNEPGAARLHRLALAAIGFSLVFIVAAKLAVGLAILFQPREVEYGEAIMHDKAARLLHGKPLYHPYDQPPYSVANYTPLFYVLSAGLQAVLGPGFAPGRAVSIIAAVATTGLVAMVVMRRLRDRWAGAFAALLFIGLGLPGKVPWFALYKEDMLGVAFAFAAVAVLFGGTGWRRIALAGALVALAFLTKQTMVAAGAAGVIWLWRLDWRKAAFFLGAIAAIVVPICLAAELSTHAFLNNTVMANVRPSGFQFMLEHLEMLGRFQLGVLLVVGIYVLSRRQAEREQREDLLVLYWLASAIPLVGLGRAGANHNYWIELAATTSVLAGMALWPSVHRAQSTQQLYSAVACSLLVGVNVVMALLVLGTSDHVRLELIPKSLADHGSFNELVERVRSEQKDVLAEPLDVVVLTRRPIMLEPADFAIQRAGRVDFDGMARRICSGEAGLLVPGSRLSRLSRSVRQEIILGDTAQDVRRPTWPAPLARALDSAMVNAGQQDGRYLYVPRHNLRLEECLAKSRA